MKKTEYLFDNFMLTGDDMAAGSVTVMSEGQIVEEYFDDWLQLVVKSAKNKNSNAYNLLRDKLSDACVDDFVTVHFGWKKQ